MIRTAISTLSVSLSLRESIRRTQSDLLVAQIELASGRHYDSGLALGSHVARNIGWHAQFLEFRAIADANALAGSRAKLAQDAMTAVNGAAKSFLDTLTAARGAPDGQQLAKTAAKAALDTLFDLLDTTYQGQAIFGGIETATVPFDDYPGSTAKASVDAAFLAAFGIGQGDPAVSGISAASMKTFVDGAFAALFDSPSWQSDWSAASDKVLKSRIDVGLTVESTVSANAEPFRLLAKAYTMVFDLGSGTLNQQTFEAIVDTALATVGGAMAKLGFEQSKLGLAQQQITEASERVGRKLTLITGDIQATESVDPYEATTRVNLLMTQLETSYSLTARLSRLSLLNHL